MNIYELLSTHSGELIAIVSGLIGGSLIERKRKKIEVKQADADATGKIMDLYQEALDDLKKRYEEREKDMQAQYDDKLAKLENKFNERFAKMEDLIKKLRSNLELWKNKYRKLKEAFDQYREKHGDK